MNNNAQYGFSGQPSSAPYFSNSPAQSPASGPSPIPGSSPASGLPQYPAGAPYPSQKSSNKNLIKTIVIVVLSVVAAIFLGLFIWMYVQWNDVSTDVSGQIEVAVREAEYNLRTQLETEFEEREKYPYKTFAGPADYGELTFEYPKTWSVYISQDASNGGDFEAYLNPDHVPSVSRDALVALRVNILNTPTEDLLSQYNDKVEDGEMTYAPIVVNNATVNVYRGELDSGYRGLVCVIKIRDKSAVLQTDAMVFEDDFMNLLKTVRFKA